MSSTFQITQSWDKGSGFNLGGLWLLVYSHTKILRGPWNNASERFEPGQYRFGQVLTSYPWEICRCVSRCVNSRVVASHHLWGFGRSLWSFVWHHQFADDSKQFFQGSRSCRFSRQSSCVTSWRKYYHSLWFVWEQGRSDLRTHSIGRLDLQPCDDSGIEVESRWFYNAVWILGEFLELHDLEPRCCEFAVSLDLDAHNPMVIPRVEPVCCIID